MTNTKEVERKVVRLKCGDCKDYLEVTIDGDFVHIQMEVVTWPFWHRVKYAFGIIFRYGRYAGGAIIWCRRKRFTEFIKEFNSPKE